MDPAPLEKILRSQQEQFLQTQSRLIKTLTEQFQTKLTTEKKNVNSVDGIANSITEFQFNSETKQTFASWWNLFCEAGSSRCLSTNESWWRFQKSSLDQHTQGPISILPPSIWRHVSTSNFSTMDTMLTRFPGVSAYIDDIIITGTTKEVLLHHLISVLDRIQQYRFCLRLDKFKFF